MSEEIQLLADVIEMAQLFEQRDYCPGSVQDELDMLEARISAAYTNVTKEIRALSGEPFDSDERNVSIQTRLFIGATWIYFIRMARHISGSSTTVTSILGDVFDDKKTGIDTLQRCNLPFAVLIMGSEAASEARRRSVLDLIDRAADAVSSPALATSAVYNPLGYVADMLRTSWMFDDLHVGHDGGRHLDYRHKMHLVFAASEVMPALA